jgi:urease accessory protein
MTTRAAVSCAVSYAMTTAPAHAHTVIEGVSGFPGGLLHPVLVPAHLLLLLTLGLLAGQQRAAHRRVLIPLLPLSQIAAVLLIASAFAFDSQIAILLVCAIAGILVAFGRALPLICTAALTAGGGVALMLDSVPALTSVRETLAALSGTAFSALALFVLVATISARLTQPWPIVAGRVLGSWAAASAILVLALRLGT